MNRTSRPSRVALLVAVIAAGLAACSGAGQEADATAAPAPQPEQSAPAEESAAPEPAAPQDSPTADSNAPRLRELTTVEVIGELPPLAREEDLLGAAAFARFFMDLHPRIFESPTDAVLFAQLSDPACEVCVSSLNLANDFRFAGVTVEGGYYVWGDLLEAPFGSADAEGAWIVEETAEFIDAYTYDEFGTVLTVDEGGEMTVTTRMEFVDGHWRMLGISTAPVAHQ